MFILILMTNNQVNPNWRTLLLPLDIGLDFFFKCQYHENKSYGKLVYILKDRQREMTTKSNVWSLIRFWILQKKKKKKRVYEEFWDSVGKLNIDFCIR